MMHPVYGHARLDRPRMIRILTLHPGELDAPVCGNLECVSIADARDYTPVSYTWNNPARTDQMYLGTGAIRLTRSVHDLLRRLRLLDQPRRLWVDQVCINQDDDHERSDQVQTMSKIFSQAERVVVWLGHDTEGDAEPAFALVHVLSGILETAAKADMTHLITQSSDSALEWEPLRQLTRRDWFTRTWIVQEIGTAVPATLLWGQAEIEWDLLASVCDGLQHNYHLREALDIKTSRIRYHYRRFVEPVRTSRHANRFNFVYELHRARQLQVSDPRDRVFAFLGHFSRLRCTNKSLLQLTASYEQTTVEQVYLDVAKRALRDTEDPLIALAAVQHSILEQNSLPSWVPDWRTNESFILSEPTSPHRASGDVGASIQLEGTVLSIAGIEIDAVSALSNVFEPGAFHLRQSYRPVEDLWCNLLQKRMPLEMDEQYPTGESVLQAMLQTLSNGCVATWWEHADELPYHDTPIERWSTHGVAYLQKSQVELASELQYEINSVQSKANAWTRAANAACKGRRFAKTASGYLVLGPKVMQEGDLVVVLLGGKMPFCLRPTTDGYLLVGECYVHGFTNGEVLQMKGPAAQTFDII